MGFTALRMVTGHSFGQPDLVRPGFEERVGVDDLWSSPSNLNYDSVILNICPNDIGTLCLLKPLI